MINAQDAKAVVAVAPALVDAGSATSIVIDTAGFDYLTYYTQLGVMDIGILALKAQECDTDDGSFTDVPGGAPATLPSATDDGTIDGIFINLLGRMRYQKLIVTTGDGTAGVNVAALALLTRGREGTNSAAESGLRTKTIVV